MTTIACHHCGKTEDLTTDAKGLPLCTECIDRLEVGICDYCGQWAYHSICTFTIHLNLDIGITRGFYPNEDECRCAEECCCEDELECRCEQECKCMEELECYECAGVENDHEEDWVAEKEWSDEE